MNRAYTDQTTRLQYNRHLAAYYRQQIAALQQGLPRCPPSSTASTLLPEDSIDVVEVIVDDPLAAFEFPSQQETQRSTSSSSSMGTCSPNDDKDVIVTSRERTESYGSERSASFETPDSAGSSKTTSPMPGSSIRMVTTSSPVAVMKGTKAKARVKSRGKGLSRIFRRRRGGDD
ncbi:hypothetical protein LTR74_014561 [Friedmanniomyces endolithicus]|nr:hypothetical protein LTR74_014561 [Friedmanniomyces endolithicus]